MILLDVDCYARILPNSSHIQAFCLGCTRVGRYKGPGVSSVCLSFQHRVFTEESSPLRANSSEVSKFQGGSLVSLPDPVQRQRDARLLEGRHEFVSAICQGADSVLKPISGDGGRGSENIKVYN